MTNNNTITLDNNTHGRFEVFASHLDQVATGHSGWALDGLINKVHNLTGNLADYSDLNFTEALILISYLTGGIAD